MMLQQIDSWRSAQGSEMGDLALPRLQPIGLDDDIPTLTVMQFRPQPYFKKPHAPPKKFVIDSAPSPKPS